MLKFIQQNDRLTWVTLLTLGWILVSAAGFAQAKEMYGASIETPLEVGPKPWTKTAVDSSPGKFTFGVFSDLT